jgi:Tfp pilus assembly protein PilN
MLKGNLSSRPFYNEGLVNILLLAGLIVGIGLAIFNVTTILRINADRSTRTAVQRSAETETAQLQQSTQREKNSVDRNALAVLGFETYEANSLIDQRLFSWTVFFGLVEKALPLDVRLVAVAPKVEKGEFRISMIVNAKKRDDIAAFLDALQNTGSFYDMNAEGQQQNDAGTYDATLSGGYQAPPVQSVKAAGAAGGVKRP